MFFPSRCGSAVSVAVVPAAVVVDEAASCSFFVHYSVMDNLVHGAAEIEDECATPGISPDVPPPPAHQLPPLAPSSTGQFETIESRIDEQAAKRCRSWVWDHFEKLSCDEKKDQKAMCNYCNNLYVAAPSKGTSNLSNHLKCYKKYPPNIDKSQTILTLNASLLDKSGIPLAGRASSWTFNQESARKKLVEMIILDELPFRFVEREGFKRYVAEIQPRVILPSRTTIARDALELFKYEKAQLKSFFETCSSRICLTTDTWTSCQNLSYMVLTAHFIDKNWRLHKKIINFCPIAGHSGEIIGKTVERCLIDWNIDKVLTVTVDNASSNDKCIDYLRERLNAWGGLVLNGSFLHVICMAHILSLVVKEGLKDCSEHILRVRHAVRYVRSSPARLSKFKTCVEQEKLESKKLLCLDVETRWNSTYMMLDAAFRLRKAFDLMRRDKIFRAEMGKLKGVPSDADWEHVRVLLPFLKLFYETTMRISGTLYVIGNVYLEEICGVMKIITSHRDGNDLDLSVMALGMKSKYDKYWGNSRNTNVLLFIAALLDPRRKIRYVLWAINKYFDPDVALELCDKVQVTLKELYDFYASKLRSSVPTQSSSSRNASETACGHEFESNVIDASLQEFHEDLGAEINTSNHKNDLERYLEEKLLVVDKTFEVLAWWRDNAKNYEVLSLMAMDILAIPVSTVASEAAFSTGGWILDPFCSSLSPRMVEALICTQNWLRSDRHLLYMEEVIDEIEIIEQEVGLSPVVQLDESDIADFGDLII